MTTKTRPFRTVLLTGTLTILGASSTHAQKAAVPKAPVAPTATTAPTAAPATKRALNMENCQIRKETHGTYPGESVGRISVSAHATMRNVGEEPVEFQTNQVLAGSVKTGPDARNPQASNQPAPGGGLRLAPKVGTYNLSRNIVAVALQPPIGVYTVKFEADPSGLQTVPSGNKPATCKWIHGPDLEVRNIDIQPRSGPTNTTFHMTITIRNAGDEPAVGPPFWKGVPRIKEVGCCGDRRDDKWTVTLVNGALPPGGEAVVSIETSGFAAGVHTFSYETDPTKGLAEADETNNISRMQFTVTER